MRKRYVLVLLAAFTGLTAGVAFAVAANGSSGPIVKTPGGEIFKVNKEAGDTLHFAPAVITVTSGESVTFEKTDKSPDPHTVTIATSKAQLPRSFESPCKPCDAARGHLKNPKSQQGPPQMQPHSEPIRISPGPIKPGPIGQHPEDKTQTENCRHYQAAECQSQLAIARTASCQERAGAGRGQITRQTAPGSLAAKGLARSERQRDFHRHTSARPGRRAG